MIIKEIYWISPGDINQKSGGYIYNYRIMHELKELQYKVNLICLDGKWPRITGKEKWNKLLEKIPAKKTIIIDGMAWIALSYPIQKNLNKRCNIFVIIHTLFTQEYLAYKYASIFKKESQSLANASRLIATSYYTKKILKDYKIKKCNVIEPGATYQKSYNKKNYLNIITVGSIIRRKNQHALIEALNQLKTHNWTLKLIGSCERDPSYVKQIKNLCTKYNITKQVIFCDECNEIDIKKHYHWTGLLVHTAIFESFGMALTEALSYGIPVISFPAGSIININSPAIMLSSSSLLENHLKTWFTNQNKRREAYKHATQITFPSWEEQVFKFRKTISPIREGFSASWLQLREPFDHNARSTALLNKFCNFINERNPYVIDLATGLASGPKFFFRHSKNNIKWLGIDHDKKVLDQLRKSDFFKSSNSFSIVNDDISNINKFPTNVDGISTQALLDLVSPLWCNQLFDWLKQFKLPFLAGITFDGMIKWSSTHPLDDTIQDAFNIHTKWDKGFGSSLGYEAIDFCVLELKKRNFNVFTQPSNWRIEQPHQQMLKQMIHGIAQAAKETITLLGLKKIDVDHWKAQKLSLIGQLELTIGHKDLLALPK